MTDIDRSSAGHMAGSRDLVTMSQAVEALIALAGETSRPVVRLADESGVLRITGAVSSVDAFETIVALAEVFTGRPVVAELDVRPHLRVGSSSLMAHTSNTEIKRKCP